MGKKNTFKFKALLWTSDQRHTSGKKNNNLINFRTRLKPNKMWTKSRGLNTFQMHCTYSRPLSLKERICCSSTTRQLRSVCIVKAAHATMLMTTMLFSLCSNQNGERPIKITYNVCVATLGSGTTQKANV
jgi:hypothetical protein